MPKKIAIIIFAILMAKYFSPEPVKIAIDLDKLSKDKALIFDAMYMSAYCNELNYIHRVSIDKSNNRILIVCLPVDETSKAPFYERLRYFKYYTIDQYKNIKFCGWRDITYKLNKKLDKVIKTTISSGVDEKPCLNFDINNMKDE